MEISGQTNKKLASGFRQRLELVLV